MYSNIRFLDSLSYHFYRYDNITSSPVESSFSELNDYVLNHPGCMISRNLIDPDSIEVYNYNSVFHCIEIVFLCFKVMEG